MASKVDMSLDDIITKNKGSGRGNRRGGRGGRGLSRGAGTGRGTGRGISRGTGRGIGRGGRARGRGMRGGPVGRSPSGFRNPRGGGGANMNGRWSQDMYYGGATPAVRNITSGPGKLNITNLDFGVSDSDIKELFSEFGAMKTAVIHYDRSGRSLGTAHVIFDRRADAMKAIKQYNGVHLDGRPMHIEIDGVSGGGGGGALRARGGGMNMSRVSRGAPRGNVKRLQAGPRPIGRGGMRGGRGRGNLRGGRGGMRGVGGGTRGVGRGGRGGRRGGRGGAPKKTFTAEELDKELEEYTFQANK